MSEVTTAPKTYREWLQREGVEHAHCPEDCEHPQPFMSNGELICGRCAIIGLRRSVMIPCTPEVCS